MLLTAGVIVALAMLRPPTTDTDDVAFSTAVSTASPGSIPSGSSFSASNIAAASHAAGSS